MPYVEGRIIHDADSHLMELPDCLDPYFTRPMLERYHAPADLRAQAAWAPPDG